MSVIDREETVKTFNTFIDRYVDCRMSERDWGFVDGVKYCIRYIDKFAPDASQMTQIAFTFGESED